MKTGSDGRTPSVNGGESPGSDATSLPRDSSLGYDASAQTKQDGGAPFTDASAGLTYIDAGSYHGDGSFFVDGGAYADAGTRLDGSSARRTDGSLGIDASPGCAPLAACCPSLPGAMQSLCDSVAEAGNGANCAAELTELESGGNCEGVSVLASELQVAPNQMVSDGTTLFFTTNETPGLLAIPVTGGPVTTLLSGTVGPNFLAVDDVNVYVVVRQTALPLGTFPCWSIVRVPKNGSASSLVNEPGAYVVAATTLAGEAYWAESLGSPGSGWQDPIAVRRGGLRGGPTSVVGQWMSPGNPPGEISVTSSTVFVIEPASAPSMAQLFPMSSGGLSSLAAIAGCGTLVSDMNASYCSQTTGENLRIASEGTTTSLGPAASSSYIVFDDTYVYWADMVIAGTIMKAPKAGGGAATVLARDTSPTAIAVDANSVYWGDTDGYIKSVPR
jgi:hypothetical protein